MKSFRPFLPYLFSAAVIALSAHGVHAQNTTSYTPLAPLPGITGSDGTVNTSGTGSFATYVNGIYTVAILVAGILAVVMITLGGIEYMGSESFTSKEDGKKKIVDAITGLILLVSCYLILNTINPQLLNLNIGLTPPGSAAGGSGGTGTANTGATTNLGSTGSTGASPSANIEGDQNEVNIYGNTSGTV